MSSRSPETYPRHLAGCAAGAVFFGTIEFLTLSASLLGGNIGQLASLGVTLLSLVAAQRTWRWLRPPRAIPPATPRVAFNTGAKLILLFTGLLYLFLWWMAWTIPDFGWDGLHYHNPPLHFWALHGRVHWIETGESLWRLYVDSFWNGIPKGVELIGYVMLSLSSLPRLLNALNLPLIPLAVAALYCLARNLGAPAKTAWPSAALFVAIPVVTAQCVTTYIDTGVAAFYLCVFALTIPTLRNLIQGLLPKKFILPLGAASGLALGAKGPGFAVPVLAGLMILIAGWKGHIPIKRLVGFISIFALITILVGGYWPLRALIHTGSPLYPVGLKIGETTIFPGGWDYFPPPYGDGNPGWSQLQRIAVSWLNIFTDWSRAYSTNYGGLGHLWILGCVPAIVVALLGAAKTSRKSSPDRLVILVLLGFCIPLFFFMPHNHNHKVRYTIWLYGLGLPCLAFCSGRITVLKQRFLRGLGLTYLCLIALIALGEGYYTLAVIATRLDRAHGLPAEKGFSLGRFLANSLAPYPVGYRWPAAVDSPLEYVIRGTGTVALAEMTDKNELLVGHLTQGQAFGQRQILFLDPETAGDPNKILAYLKENQVQFVIYESGNPPPPALARLAVLRERVPDLFRILVFMPEYLPETPNEINP